MRIAYFYLMNGEPDRIRAVAPEHARYWRHLDLPGYLGGPTADRSAGLITFEAGSVEEAERLVQDDPFVRSGLLDGAWLKEWLPSGSAMERDLRRRVPGRSAGDDGPILGAR